MKEHSEAWSLIFMVLDEMAFPLDIFNAHPGHDKLMNFIALSTRDDYRGRGIAGELVHQAIEVMLPLTLITVSHKIRYFYYVFRWPERPSVTVCLL